MTTFHNITYHLNGMEIVNGKLNLNDGLIDGVSRIYIGDWSIEINDENELCVSNNNKVKIKISGDDMDLHNNIKYERYFMIQPCNIEDSVGLMVSGTGKYYNYDLSQTPNNNAQTIPTIKLSNMEKDPKFLGVIVSCEEYKREYKLGNISTIQDQDDEINRVLVNSRGIGSIWVCDINGNLHNGDYITTSEIEGYGMKQEDDIKHNYTGPKITQDCHFAPETFALQKPVDFDADGPIYEPITNLFGDVITDIEYQIRYIYKDGTKASKKIFEQDIERLINKHGKRDRKAAIKSHKRTVFRACLVGYSYN